MAKDKGSKKKGEDADEYDVGATVRGESMNMPPMPDEDAFDAENEETARRIAAREAELKAEVEATQPANDDMLGRLTQAMEVIANQQAGGNNNSAIEKAMDRMAAAFERMAAAQLEGADRVARATRIASRPSNEAYPAISKYNLRGDKDFPKPAFKYMILAPYPVEHESCTREEVELLNLLVPGEYMIKRNDDTKVKLTVRATYKLDTDDMDKVLINHDTAFNNDYHRLMPPFSNWLRQMLKQKPITRIAADRILTMDEEADMILAGQLNDGTTPENGQLVSVGE